MSYNVEFALGGGSSHPHGWLIESEPEYIWQDDAACAFWPATLFDLISTDDPIARDIEGSKFKVEEEVRQLNIANFEKAGEICASCPVLEQCKAETTTGDRAWVFRAGMWPTKFTGKRRGRPRSKTPRPEPKAPNPNRNLPVEERTCRRGHKGYMRLKPDGKGTVCRECHNLRERQRRLRNGSKPRTRNLVPGMDNVTCDKGHTGQWMARSDGYLECFDCRAARQAIYDEKKRQSARVGE